MEGLQDEDDDDIDELEDENENAMMKTLCERKVMIRMRARWVRTIIIGGASG